MPEQSWKDAILEVTKATVIATAGAVTVIGIIMLFVHFVWGI